MTLCLSAANLATFHLIRRTEERKWGDLLWEMKPLSIPGSRRRAEGLNNLRLNRGTAGLVLVTKTKDFLDTSLPTLLSSTFSIFPCTSVSGYVERLAPQPQKPDRKSTLFAMYQMLRNNNPLYLHLPSNCSCLSKALLQNFTPSNLQRSEMIQHQPPWLQCMLGLIPWPSSQVKRACWEEFEDRCHRKRTEKI